MTKSQNTKSEQLTEQWKKGELPEGFYYIKVKEEIANYPLLADCVEGLNYTYFLDYEDYVQQVLAPVPSYDEYLALQSDSLAKNEAVEINAELEHRLAMVKANGNYPDRISRLKSRVVATSEENEKLKEELSRESYKVSEAYCFVEELKELLKECESSIQYYQETYGAMDLDTYTLLAKLKEALK